MTTLISRTLQKVALLLLPTMVVGLAGAGGLAQALTVNGIPLPNPSTCLPGGGNPACANVDDFTIYSAPLNGLSIPSAPGAIKDKVVIYTGTGNPDVIDNPAGVDDAFPAVTGSTSSFVGTWNAGLQALVNALATPSIPANQVTNLLFFFNHNETGGDNPQNDDPAGPLAPIDLLIKAIVTIKDTDGGKPDLVYTLFGLQPGGYAKSEGTLFGIDHSLGANEVAYLALITGKSNDPIAGLCPDGSSGAAGCGFNLQDLLAAGYDTFSGILDLAALSNGFEQLFATAVAGERVDVPVPLPATALLVGASLGMLAWRRSRRP